MSDESQGNQFTFWAQALLNTPASYEPVNSIWQSISSETLLLEKHFREPSIDGHGAMNQNIFVVCRGERNSPFLETSTPNSQPRGSEKEMSCLDEWMSLCCAPHTSLPLAI